MKIAEVKKLENGVSEIIIEGKVIKLLKDPNENEYGWSQFVKIEDDTDKLACWVNIETKEDAYKIGQYIKIKGKVNKYTKRGKPQVSFSGNVIDEIVKDENVSQEQPKDNTRPVEKPVEKTVVEPEKDMEEVWEAKDLRGVKMGITRHATDLIVAGKIKLENRLDYMKEELDFFYEENVKIEMVKPEIVIKPDIVKEAIKEFGGTAVEESEEKPKEERITQAKEIVGLASQAQKDMVEKIIKSRYMTEKEVQNIGELNTLTKENASKYISYWFGDGEKIGERAERKLIAEEEQEESPFSTERQPIEKKDPKDQSSLAKDLIIEKINKMRKTYGLMDEEKFMKAFGCNTKFELWTEKELTKLKEKVEMWKPDWVTEK